MKPEVVEEKNDIRDCGLKYLAGLFRETSRYILAFESANFDSGATILAEVFTADPKLLC